MDARVFVFWEADFPFTDTAKIDLKMIIEALPPMESVRSVGVKELKERLKQGSADLLINPYGSAFPAEAWPEIRDFLSAGGNLLNLGGAPFSTPVLKDGAGWRAEPRQMGYLQELMITGVRPIDTAAVKSYDTLPTEPLLSGLTEDFSCDRTFELNVRLVDDSGARQSVLRPLLHALDGDGTAVAAPIVAIDHPAGMFADGRWVLANFTSDAMPRKEIIYRLAGFAALGASEFQIRPSFACYYPEERAALIVHANRVRKPGDEPLSLFIRIRKDNITLSSENIDISDFGSPYYRVIPLGFPLSPGLYTVEARLSPGGRELTDKFGDYYIAGFWCYDASLVSMLFPLMAGKDLFMREKPSLLLGAAYLPMEAGDGLLFDPNPAAWDRDLARMSAAGMNVVRTVMRSCFRRAMPGPGVPSEDMLRAAMAFVLTAASHELSVIFSFFASEPESWHGAGSYTDPESIRAQMEFAAAFSRRLGQFNNVIWDLIDRPLLPGDDTFVEKGFADWDAKRRSESKAPGDAGSDGTALCRRLFAQEAFAGWVRRMSGVIRQNGNPKQLITVGLDDDACGPDPQLVGTDVDFTGAHNSSWDGGGLWAALSGKVHGRPVLVLETVQAEDLRQSEFQVEDPYLIERKIVTVFAAGAAGALDWMYDSRDGESATGFLRADLTARPTLQVLPKISAFLKAAKAWMVERQLPDVCVIVPQSGTFSGNGRSAEAVKRCMHVIHYHYGIPVRAVAEYALENLGSPRFVILPCAGMLSQSSWEELLRVVDAGGLMLVTGTVGRDELCRHTDRLSQLGIDMDVEVVEAEESAIIFGSEHRLVFSEGKSGSVEKGSIGGQSGVVKVVPHGSGKLILAPLPFELADNPEPTAALYSFALRQAGVQPSFTVSQPDPAILIRPQAFKDAVMYSLVSEADVDRQVELTDALTGRALTVNLPAKRAVIFLLNREDGRVLAQYGDGVQAEDEMPGMRRVAFGSSFHVS